MKLKQTHLTYGLVTGLIMVVFGLVLHFTDLTFKPGMNWVPYIPFLVGIILNAIAFSKANDEYVTFGNVLSSGVKMSLIITVISIIWAFAAMAVFPGMAEKGMEIARQSMEEKGMPDEQIEQGLEMSRKYFGIWMVLGISVGYMFFGTIFSLIGGAVAKKKGALPEHMQQ